MRSALGIVTGIGLVLLAGCGPGELRAGAGSRVVDLPVGVGLGGYLGSDLFLQPPADDPGGPARMLASSRGIYAAPTVKVVLFERGGERLAIAKIDAALMSAALLERTVQLAKEEAELDLSGGRLLLSATHSHAAGHGYSTPSFHADMAQGREPDEQDALAHAVDSFSQEMTDRAARSLVAALVEARAALKPAVVGHAFGENKTAGHDRRCADDKAYGKGNVDERLTVIRVDEKESGQPIAVMFHYAMHGVLYDYQNRNLSGDAPAHAEFEIERSFDSPVVALYLQGAAGDVNPSGEGFRESQGMQRVGADLGASVVALHGTITPSAEVELKATQRWFPISRAILGYAEGEFPEDGAILCQQDYAAECDQEPKATDEVICVSKALPDGGKYYGLVGAAKLGDLHFVTAPGEPVAEFARKLRDGTGALGHPETVVLGYAQDHDGYLLTDEDWLRGGYEPSITFWGWRYGPYLISQTVDAFRELLGEEPTSVRPEPVARPDLTPRAYEPTPTSPSRQAPAIVSNPSQSVRRLDEVRFAFYGGDPLLGHPEVTLERRAEGGGYEPVRVNGWWTVTNLRGAEMATFYSPNPTYRQEAAPAARDHQWEVVYEPPRDLPEAAYRFVARGEALVGGETQAYELASEPFVVEPAALLVDVAPVVVEGTLKAELRLRYPAEAPRMSESPGNGTWQIGNFRAVDVRFAPPTREGERFVPVVENAKATSDATVTVDGVTSAALVQWVPRPYTPGHQTWEPGQGPGFVLEAAVGAGAWQVTIPAGALQDGFGNANSVAVVFPAD